MMNFRKIIFIILCVLFYVEVSAQNNIWYSFYNSDVTLVGYKDKNGSVKIKPKFDAGFTSANRFANIIAVAENNNNKWTSYYLTKTGKIAGIDSLYIFDNTTDCEQEGFIRFKDSKSDKVGLLNRAGDVVIPAMYNDLSVVKNGMIVALLGATKKSDGEHFRWIGGKEILIDTSDHTLIDSFDNDANLNFYDVVISKEIQKDSIRKSYPALNGNYYSYVDYKKEFTNWFTTSFLKKITKENILKNSFSAIKWNENEKWISINQQNFVDRHFYTINKICISESKNIDIVVSSIDPLLFPQGKYPKYYNNCNEPLNWKYPVMSVIITSNNKQSRFDFLRTQSGYKLMAVNTNNN